MNPQQLDRLLGAEGERSGDGHGIGFNVVRDLVATSGGEIRVMSEPEIGTRVQVEWPIVAMPATETDKMDTLDLPPEYSRPIQCPVEIMADARTRHMRNLNLYARIEGTL